MPKDSRIKKVLVIGSGPIIIGQAAEFDYAGTQACRALKEEGIEVVLINSNPATIMTDKDIADKVYIEPLTVPVVKSLIIKEQPDSILPTLGGQNALNIAMALADEGFLEEHNVQTIGTSTNTIKLAEDRLEFKTLMENINEPCAASLVVNHVDDALEFAKKIGYPVVVRPAYTLGGTGGGIAYDETELHDICSNGLRLSRVSQCLIERCIAGWKEIEYEVMRDGAGNCITVCNMENLDPVGVHTGDSIVVAPSQTLSDKEYQMLRTSALNIITALDIQGGCNVQYALNPDSFEYCVIEVNPRSSRTVPYISKVTGIPIVKLATKVITGAKIRDLGYEPGLQKAADYYAIKMPVFSFEKIRGADISLGPEMKSTGECLGISKSFDEALYKAFEGAGIRLPKHKQIIMTLADKDKQDGIDIAQRFEALGYKIYASRGTAKVLKENGVHAIQVNKIGQEAPTLLDLILEHKIDLVIDTPENGIERAKDGFLIRRYAIETGVHCLTSLDTAHALISSLEHAFNNQELSIVDIATIDNRG